MKQSLHRNKTWPFKRYLHDLHSDNIIKGSKKTYTQDYVLVTRQLNHKSDNDFHNSFEEVKNNFIKE